HPSMLMAALSDTGVEPDQAVMIGDTVFDMDMSKSASIPFIGVSCGYHRAHQLTDAIAVLDDIRDLPGILSTHWRHAS
ncbi:MAG: HAD hydrolase-like protein, partial [Pseudomonadota bacterium]